MCEFEGFGAGRLRSILCQSVRFATSPRIPQHHGYSPHIPAQFSFSVHTPRRARTRSTSKICLLVCSYSDDIEVFFVGVDALRAFRYVQTFSMVLLRTLGHSLRGDTFFVFS